jgi:hypothetical protein
MSSSEFPPNSAVSKKGQPVEKNLERVTSGEPVRRKKSLRKQFSETFVAGDMRSAVVYVVMDVLLPAAKDMIVEAGSQGIEKLIFGDSSRRRGARPPVSGPTGYVSYNRLSGPMSGGSRLPGPQRAMSRAARGRHNFDEIVLEQRNEAEEVIDRLFDLVSRYDQATVADLYELVGLESSHTDHKWGWEDLHGAGVSRVRGGYLLDLPEPEPLD